MPNLRSETLEALGQKYGTPLYAYSLAELKANIAKVRGAFDEACPQGLACYAVKANSHLALLRYLSEQGFGFDIVSHGELLRVQEACPQSLGSTVYSGSAKTVSEIHAAVEAGVLLLNAESPWEARRSSEAAVALKKEASLSLRVNPAVDPATHRHISTGVRGAKFGIPAEMILPVAKEVLRLEGVALRGLSCHIGSMVGGEKPFLRMLEVMESLARTLLSEGAPLEYLDMGGGFPICYVDEQEIDYLKLFKTYRAAADGLGLRVIIEPGRSIIGSAAVLLARVVHIKEAGGKRFVFIDAGFTELIRPALYDASHRVVPVAPSGEVKLCTLAGPICESTDVFAEDIPLAVEEGSLVLIENAGAYGASMASNYNTRPKVAEILVDGAAQTVLTPRQAYPALWQDERRSF